MAPSSAPRSDAGIVERARAIAPLIREHALRTEQERSVPSEVAAACGSTAFTALIQAGCAFIAALFPDEAQDEIFTSPDVRVGGTLIPDATAVATADGYVVNGTSSFATGCRHADWHLLTV